MSRKIIYPGTFDPPHRGHLDLIERGSRLADELIVAIAINPEKRTLFSAEERKEMLMICCRRFTSVRVLSFEGLAADLVKRESAQFFIRGVRSYTDFEAEFSMAQMNRHLCQERGGGDTLFLLPDPALAHISSRWIKEIAAFGGDIHPFLPAEIAARVADKLVRHSAVKKQ